MRRRHHGQLVREPAVGRAAGHPAGDALGFGGVAGVDRRAGLEKSGAGMPPPPSCARTAARGERASAPAPRLIGSDWRTRPHHSHQPMTRRNAPFTALKRASPAVTSSPSTLKRVQSGHLDLGVVAAAGGRRAGGSSACRAGGGTPGSRARSVDRPRSRPPRALRRSDPPPRSSRRRRTRRRPPRSPATPRLPAARGPSHSTRHVSGLALIPALTRARRVGERPEPVLPAAGPLAPPGAGRPALATFTNGRSSFIQPSSSGRGASCRAPPAGTRR